MACTTIVKPTSLQDIKDCVEIYHQLNDHSFIDMSVEESIRTISMFARQNKFIRVKKVDNETVAWIMCEKTKPYHQTEFQLQQVYYASKRSGIAAYKDVIDLHDAMIKEAKDKNIPIVISTGSHMDPENTFTRILARVGWERRGYVALRRLVPRLPRGDAVERG